MDSADGAAVHVVLPNQRQQQTKAEAALQEAAAYRAPAHNETATWSNDDPAKSDPSWSSCTMWTLFAVGWLFTPCWWLGVASGLTSGGDSSCLLRRRRGLKQGQKAAWWAHVIMSLVSALVVVLVCAIYFSNTGPERTAASYLVLSGREDAYPNLNDQLKLRKVAEALHAALNLDTTYPAANIRIWLAAAHTVSATPSRHLLEVRTKVVVLGYSLAKVPGLPEPAVLATLVQDTATTQKLAERLAAAEFLAPQFASLVSIGFAPVSMANADDVILQLTDGAGVDQHFLAPIGALLSSPGPGPGPYFLLMKGDSEAYPSLNDTAVLATLSQALHDTFNVGAAYPASNIQVSVANSWERDLPGRKLLIQYTVHRENFVVLSYSFSTSEDLPAQEALEAAMNDTAMGKVLADNLAVLDFIPDEDHQDAIMVSFTIVQSATEAASQLWNTDTDDHGPAYFLMEMNTIGKHNCRVEWNAPSTCNATVPGGSGYTTTTFSVSRPPTNGGTPCPEPMVATCTVSGCVGTPANWTAGALLAHPPADVYASAWSCPDQVQGMSWPGGYCNSTCHPDPSVRGPGDSEEGPVAAVCDGSTGAWVVQDGGCYIARPGEFEFDPAAVTAAGQLNGSEWSFASFTGFTLHDKTNISGPIAGMLMCNSTIDLTPASTVAGNKSLVMMPVGGAMNASAVVTRVDGNPWLMVQSFWVLSLKHAANLTIIIEHGASDSTMTVPMVAMAPQKIIPDSYVNYSEGVSYTFEVTFEVPFCDASDTPMLIIDEFKVRPPPSP